MTVQTPDLLATIVAATRRTVELRSARVPMAEMERRAGSLEPRPSAFANALERSDPFDVRRDRINVIAECKRRSPSRGVLRREYDPAAIAKSYQGAGAAAISVLTEPTFFDGALDHLAAVRAVTTLPIVRKDFVVDRYQILEARAAGADAILLIVAALSPGLLRTLHRAAADAGLAALVEVHDIHELPVALEAGATIVGVNNRNLRTLAVDAEVSERLVEEIPEHVLAVAESGLKTSDDLKRLRGAGYDAFLIGERFMTADDPGAALKGLLCS
jgi:indole-3-glycerol phosphate synthase